MQRWKLGGELRCDSGNDHITGNWRWGRIQDFQVLDLSSLMSGMNFKKRWTTIGGYFSSSVEKPVRILYLFDDTIFT